jgi:ferredoxin-type protein NapH
MSHRRAGAEATAAKGWLRAQCWLLARRLCQLAILALFLLGPLAAVWVVKGNLAYSLTLDTLPLTDPYVLLQSLLAGHLPEKSALIGALIVIIFYILVGGRVYCAWVCPLNPVTDLAGWLRYRLGIKGSVHVARSSRYWILAMTLLLPALTGTIAWELVNPVSMLQRGLIFGLGAAWTVVLAVFLFDLFVMSRGWCGHLCPVGAFYSLLGKWSPLRGRRVEARGLQRLHGLLRGLPGTAGHSSGTEGRRQGRRPGHSGRQLYQLRALHRCLFQGCLHVRPAFQQPARQTGADRHGMRQAATESPRNIATHPLTWRERQS